MAYHIIIVSVKKRGKKEAGLGERESIRTNCNADGIKKRAGVETFENLRERARLGKAG